MATTKTQATSAALMREVRIQVAQLRATARQIGLNIDSMQGTQVRIGETCSWEDPRIEQIERDIEAARADRARVLDKVASLLTLPHKAA